MYYKLQKILKVLGKQINYQIIKVIKVKDRLVPYKRRNLFKHCID